MILRHLRVLTVAAIAVASLSGCKKSPPQRVEPLPFPGAADYRTSALGNFTALLKTLPVAERALAVERFLHEHPIWPLIENDTLASFVWFGKAKVVAINGDLQYGWSRPDTIESIPCGNDTLFARVYTLPPDARLDYLLLVDGRETTDPRNPRITPSGFGPHSEVAMPKFVSNPVRQPRQNVPHGTLDSLAFTSSIDSLLSRPLLVYKPAGYEHLSALPSLYVYEGFEALENMAYPTVLDNLIYDRKIEPVLVVFVPSIGADAPFLFERHQEFSNVICGELVRLIDQKYKTAATPERRAMAAISAGGQFALLNVFNRPDMFLCVAAQSPTIKEEHFRVFHEAWVDSNVRPAFRIYFDVGRYDLIGGGMEGLTFLQANRKFHEELEKYGLVHVYHEVNGGHQWADWRERTEEILVYFFGGRREVRGAVGEYGVESREYGGGSQ
jgi:enterochelin esterase-like enzyme